MFGKIFFPGVFQYLIYCFLESMDRLVILSEELKKYFILTDEKGKYKHSQWKCNVDECGKIMDIGIRMEHLRHNHINIFQQIDKKLPKDIIKNVYQP